jgi:glycosyltransferase involved in cell wall biosynthesis
MICSWLDIEKGIGSFFEEQASFVKEDFNIGLVNFSGKKVKFKTIFSIFKKYPIRQLNSPNGLPIYIVDYPILSFLPKKINYLILKKKIRCLNKFLKRKGFFVDLMHAQSTFNAGLEAQYYHQITGIPFIITEHNQFSLRGKSRFDLKRIDMMFQQSSAFLVVSFDKIRQFAANGLFTNFEVIGNSINKDLFNSDLTIRNNELFTIITIGAFDPLKDQKTILKALKIVDNSITHPIIFKWIGFNSWGSEASIEVENLVNEFNYKNIILELTPSLNRVAIANELKNSDLFLFSSISEGMPVSVLEALACGLPVCTTRCGGVDEIINNSNGTIVQIKDFTAIADFVIKIMNNELIFHKKNISENIIKNYGNEAFANKMKKIYLSAIN